MEHAHINWFSGTPYRLRRVLGEGRFARAFEVEHRRTGEVRVAKVLHRSAAAHPRVRERFRVDAGALKTLRHPHVVRFIEMGELRGHRPFFVIEKLDGPTLGHVVLNRYVSVVEAVRWTAQIVSALSAAHAIKIVHRDLHLGNAMLHQTDTGECVKVLDFGQALVLEGSPLPPLTHPTEEHLLVGSPRFLSPEAVLSEPISERADIYAAGLVLFSLLTGRLPHADAPDTRTITLAQVWQDLPPPSSLRPEVPASLDTIVARATQKNPSERFASADQFREALKRVKLPTISEETTKLNSGG